MTTIDTSDDSGYVVKLENVPVYDKTRKLFQSYPGPLVKSVSHKKTVIEFCEEKLKQDQLLVDSHRASHSLLWNYLILMLRQNGNYTEGDISELLMRNAEEFKSSLDNTVSLDDIKHASNEDNTDVSESEGNAISERNSNSVSQSHVETTASALGMPEKVVIHKFRDYLLYGNINDALEFATDNNLWGHALFLASKVDRRQHANVMLKFANKLPYNDPLQTLYQIMSGRVPSCVSNLDDKWGDWRPHLAMIISNCTDKPELVKRSIVTLGDSLASRGDVFGSQFCYLLVEPNFSDYSEEGKLVLLGKSSLASFKEFANNDAIIMTEVYEYARSLSDEHFFVPSLQKFKHLMAGRMLDYGMQLKCLLYMEQIAKCISTHPGDFDKNFIAKVYDLADKLKFYDPVMEKSYEDNFNNNELDMAEDQQWLKDLAVLNQGLSEASNYQTEYAPQTYETDVYSPMSYQPVSIPGIYDPMSQHQTPTHAPAVSFDEEPPNQEQQQVIGNHVESYNQYQQPEQNYSYEYNSTVPNDGQRYPEQLPYDPQMQQHQQQPSQPDYGYGWDQVRILNLRRLVPLQIRFFQNYQQPTPTISMGNSVSEKLDAAQKSKNIAEVEDKKNSTAKSQEAATKAKKGAAPDASASGKGWLGGFISKLSMKPKNQMILPDDKNPTVRSKNVHSKL